MSVCAFPLFSLCQFTGLSRPRRSSSGQAATASSGDLATPSAAARRGAGTGVSSSQAAWLRAGLQSGRSLDDMAAEKGGSSTRHTVAAAMIDLYAAGAEGIDPDALVPLVFYTPPGLLLPFRQHAAILPLLCCPD